MLKTSDIQPGAKVYTIIREEPWTVVDVDADNIVTLQRSHKRKVVKKKSMLYNYTLVGSEADLRHREICKRHNWPVWE